MGSMWDILPTGVLGDAPLRPWQSPGEGVETWYEEAVDDFRQQYDIAFDPPPLRVSDTVPYLSVDRDAVTVHPGYRDHLQESGAKDQFQDEVTQEFRQLYDEALATVVSDRMAWLETVYEAYDPAFNIDQVYFDDLNPDEDAPGNGAGTPRTLGDYCDGRLRIDEQLMPELGELLPDIDTDSGTVDWHDDDRHYPRLYMIAIHEAVHAMDAVETVRAAHTTVRDPAENVYGAERDWPADIRNATFEAKTTFTEWLAGWRGRTTVLDAVDDPQQFPAFFDGYLDMYGPRDANTVRDPYNLGFFTALSHYKAVAAEQGRATAFDDMQQFIFREAYTVEELQGLLEDSLDRRGIHNYPRKLSRYHELLQWADDDLVATADMSAGCIRTRMETAGTAEERLAADLDGHALLQAYEQAADDPVDTDRIRGLRQAVTGAAPRTG